MKDTFNCTLLRRPAIDARIQYQITRSAYLYGILPLCLLVLILPITNQSCPTPPPAPSPPPRHGCRESWTTMYLLPTLDQEVHIAYHELIGTLCLPWTTRYPLPTLDH